MEKETGTKEATGGAPPAAAAGTPPSAPPAPPPKADEPPADWKEQLGRLKELEAEEKSRTKAKLSEEDRLKADRAELDGRQFRIELREADVPAELTEYIAVPAKGGAKVARDFSAALDKHIKAKVAEALAAKAGGTPPVGRPAGGVPPAGQKEANQGASNTGPGKLRSLAERTPGPLSRK